MQLSVFDIFKIGIGPSSSHTVGPMLAGLDFVKTLEQQNLLDEVDKIKIHLYGSLALTKTGHGTDIALQLGLMGYSPQTIEPNNIMSIVANIKQSKKIILNKIKKMTFDSDFDIIMHKTEELPYHPNGLIIMATNESGTVIFSQEYYSVGGGFIETKEQMEEKISKTKQLKIENKFKYNFNSWFELAKICKKENKEVWEIILDNEKTLRDEDEIDKQINTIYEIMIKSIDNGLKRKGEINGGLYLKRRSAILEENIKKDQINPLNIIDKIMLWGMAVGEENASYGRIITAPTNGASGVIPAVFRYYKEYCSPNFIGIKKFILTAGAVGILCKLNASISGAEGGCQAEIGVATAMASAGLTSALGGTLEQCENSAIIGLCHNLGLTCDPVAGLVQVPCIERNAINAVKAVSASRLGLLEQKSNYLMLDQVIATLKEVGDNMPSIYRETALGGLAKNAKGCCGDCGFCS